LNSGRWWVSCRERSKGGGTVKRLCGVMGEGTSDDCIYIPGVLDLLNRHNNVDHANTISILDF